MATRVLTVRAMTPEDWPAVREIYAEGIATGDATFECDVPSWDEWHATHLNEHRMVAVDQGNIVGWVAASPVSGRCVYRGVVEHSVYVAQDARGHGVGRALLETFITSTEAAGIWTIESGIFPENTASLALHQRCGFRRVGIRERLGEHGGRWRDVVLVERRSR